MKNWREKGRMIRSKEKENFKQAGRKTWLVHNSEIDRMTCSVCIQYASSDLDKKAVFVTGSSNFKLESDFPSNFRAASKVSW
jgi:hypothetical protein